MTNLFKPLRVALKGKGLGAFLKRVWTIRKRYGLTAAKMDRALAHLVQILAEFDCHATLPVTAVALGRNSSVIQKYQDQGVEFAVHGYVHVDHSQLPMAEQRDHLRRASQIFRDADIRFDGFRCPYLRWNESTIAALEQTDFVYDSSNSLVWEVADRHKTESYRRVLEFYGARPAADYMALPSWGHDTGIVRIPYCLPDDESLVERLNWDAPNTMEQVWPDIFEQIHQRGELFALGLHPERTSDCASALVNTLQQVRAEGPAVWRAPLGEIARWWKTRYAAHVQVTRPGDGVLQLDIDGPPDAVLLLRSVEAKTSAEPWFDGYQRANELPCIIHTPKRPFIGISPGADPALTRFLKQQGYIVETSSRPSDYVHYIASDHFAPEDERHMVDRIEATEEPLVRLGRWPGGARSAFCVTGDIDALTLRDYFQRLRQR